MSSDPPEDRTAGLTPGERGPLLLFESLRPGALFAGRYRIAGTLGSGGAGHVFRAHDELADHPVALKVLFPGGAQHTLERLRRELRLVRPLRHPGIVRLHDIGAEGGLLYVVSELLEGESLHDYLAARGRPPVAEARRIAAAVLDALGDAHAHGIVHRDVKPSNIFLARDPAGGAPRVVLLDFGLAREGAAAGATSVGRFVGTPKYCAPEQVRGEGTVGPPADLYACGVVLWEMLAGDPPFHGMSEVEILEAHMRHALPRLPPGLREAPPAMVDLVQRLLEKEPRRRPRDAGAARELLARRGQVAPRLARALRALRRRRALSAAAAVLAVALGAGAMRASAPLAVSVDDGRVAWLLRAGATVRSAPFARPVAAAALAGRGAWAVLEAPAAGEPRQVPALLRADGPWSPWRGWGLAGPGFYEHEEYAGCRGAFRPRLVLALDDLARPGEARVALSAIQAPNYPDEITLVFDERTVASYLHPGHVWALRAGRAPGGGPLMLVGIGVNNHAGGRPVLFGLPAELSAEGQAPPYLAPLARRGRAQGWYDFLPFEAAGGRYELTVEDGRIRVQVGSGAAYTVDLEHGVPTALTERAGLDATAWVAARTALDAALLDAARAAQAGDPSRGAARLAEFAARPAITPTQQAVAWLRAAQLDLAAADYRRALVAVDAARAREPGVPRARLLQAELLLRTGRRDDLVRALDAWGRDAEEPMYTYEWYLVDWLAGMPVAPERLLAHWTGSERQSRPWGVLLATLDAYRRGAFDEALRAVDDAHEAQRLWPAHHYWAARAALDAPRPDLPRAARHLEQAAAMRDDGASLPLAAARCAAAGAAATAALRDAARAELRSLEGAAPAELEALAVLPFARADLARCAPR